MASVDAWRAERDRSLRADDGWLTLVGLFWFQEGRQTIGSSHDASFVLPASAPPIVGTFRVQGEAVWFQADPDVDVRVGPKRATSEWQVRDDRNGSPDVLRFGSCTMLVIKRGSRLGLRVRDTASSARRQFEGERWYRIDPRWRIDARWVAHDAPRQVRIHNVVGDDFDMLSPGYAVFTVNGREVRLDPVVEATNPKELFFIFKDATAGETTYPAGRFLYTGLPAGGRLVLDFNKAHNPPCAFTPFATCPLPPRQNVVPIRIEAGALTHGD